VENVQLILTELNKRMVQQRKESKDEGQGINRKSTIAHSQFVLLFRKKV